MVGKFTGRLILVVGLEASIRSILGRAEDTGISHLDFVLSSRIANYIGIDFFSRDSFQSSSSIVIIGCRRAQEHRSIADDTCLINANNKSCSVGIGEVYAFSQ